MTDRHKQPPLSLRPPEVLRRWVEAEAARRGVALQRVIIDALERARQASGAA